MISVLLSPRFGACTAGIRPFPLAMHNFYSFVSHVLCLLLFSRCGACTAGIRPFPLSSISIYLSPRCFLYLPKQVTVRGAQAFLRMSALLRDNMSAFRPACLPCFPSCWSLCPPCLPSVSFCFPWEHRCSVLGKMSPFLLVTVSVLFCVLSPFLSVTVSALSPFCLPLCPVLSPFVGHCVRLVSLPSPFVSLGNIRVPAHFLIFIPQTVYC